MHALMSAAVLLAIGGAVGVGGALFWMDYRRQREMFENALRLDRSGNSYLQSYLLGEVNQLQRDVKGLTEQVKTLQSDVLALRVRAAGTDRDYFDSSK
jgi:hypothetical protein